MELEDCTCRICLCILIEPVRMPCGHELCLKCFKDTVQQANLSCPLCRYRIGSWSRLMSRQNRLVDNERWNQIKEAFPDEVQRRVDGVEDDESVISPISDFIRQNISEPGEIRKEYEVELKKMQEQLLEEQRREAEASERLISQLQQADMLSRTRLQENMEQVVQRDEQYAQSIAHSQDVGIDTTPKPSSSFDDHGHLSMSQQSQPEMQTPRSRVKSRDSNNSCSLEPYLERIRKGDEARKEYKYPIQNTLTSDDPLLSQAVSDMDANSRCSSFSVKGGDAVNADLMKFSITPLLERSEIFPDASLSQSAFKSSLPATPVASKSTLKNVCSQSDVDVRKTALVLSSPSCSKSFFLDVDILPTSSDFTRVASDDGKPSPSAHASTDNSAASQFTFQGSDSSNVSDRPGKEKVSSAVSSRVSQLKRSTSSSSIDRELVHFRPIETCPKTPPRRLPSGRMVESQIIKCTPRNVHQKPAPIDGHPDALSPDSYLGSPIMQRRMAALVSERKRHIADCSKSTSISPAILRLNRTDEKMSLKRRAVDDDVRRQPKVLRAGCVCGEGGCVCTSRVGNEVTGTDFIDYTGDNACDRSYSETVALVESGCDSTSHSKVSPSNKSQKSIDDYFSPFSRDKVMAASIEYKASDDSHKQVSIDRNVPSKRTRNIRQPQRYTPSKVIAAQLNNDSNAVGVKLSKADAKTNSTRHRKKVAHRINEPPAAKSQENNSHYFMNARRPRRSDSMKDAKRSRLVTMENVLSHAGKKCSETYTTPKRKKCHSVPVAQSSPEECVVTSRKKLVNSAQQLVACDHQGRRNSVEDSDHVLALQLQSKYTTMDRYNIQVDREYSLRKRGKKT